jgi:hypothetical protein
VLALLIDLAKIHTMKAELASRKMLLLDLESSFRPPLQDPDARILKKAFGV